MKYRKLGRWGVRVSEISLGSWITYGGSVADEAAADCINRAYELGVNFFDTANAYMRGEAERVMGQVLARYPRDSYVLATKVFFPMGDAPNQSGLSRKHIFEQAHASLERLGTDHIDLYQCHRYDEDTPLEETVRAMDDLIRQGKIIYWGTSEWTADQIAAAVSLAQAQGWAPPVSNQPHYNAIYRRIEKKVLPTTEGLGVGNVVWSPLAMGILTGKYTNVNDVPADSRAATEARGFMSGYFTQEVLDAVAKVSKIAADSGMTMSQLALRWILRQRNVSSVIVGASKVSHVEDNVQASDVEVSADALEEVTRILDPVVADGEGY